MLDELSFLIINDGNETLSFFSCVCVTQFIRYFLLRSFLFPLDFYQRFCRSDTIVFFKAVSIIASDELKNSCVILLLHNAN